MPVHIDRLLETAIRLGAESIHLHPGHPPFLRVDRRLRSLETSPLSASDIQALIDQLAPRATPDPTAPRCRLFAFSYGEKGRCRVSITEGESGPALDIRVRPSRPLTSADLGMPKLVQALCRRPRGLILVCSPIAGGKTSVVDAMLQFTAENFPRSIVTIQQPIEFTFAHDRACILKQELDRHTPDLPTAIADALRVSADVIAIDIDNDSTAITAAIEAATHSALVILTLRDRGAARAIQSCEAELARRFPSTARLLLADALVAVLSTDLIPRMDSGLVLLHEFLLITPAITELIRTGAFERIDAAIRAGRKYGMQLLDDHLFKLVAEGQIDAEHATEAARNPAEFQERLEKRARGDDEGDDEPPTQSSGVPRPNIPPGLSGHA